MSRCLIIINPVSGGGAARRYALDLQWKLSTLFETIEVKFTRGEGDATRFAKNACERGFDAVFCMGGDGTVNETVNGIAQGGFSCTFGFIPVVMIGISAIILQLVLFLRLWMKLRQRKKAYSALLRISCEQAKRCSLQRTTRTASKQRTTISSANPLSF